MQKNIHRMMKFAALYPDKQIVAPVVRRLSWSHILLIIPIGNELQRTFYLTMEADQHWSKRTLKAKIDGMLYERTAIAKQSETVIKS